ncbi:MAG: hypothetical protein WBF13_01650 [Candidatus Zixiibacteriota bacterium]
MATAKENSVGKLNRILVTETSFWKELREGGKYVGEERDFSSFRFIVEELVAHSATEIAIIPLFHDQLLPCLPTELRKRVAIVDHRFEQLRATHSLLTPVYEEFGIRPRGGAFKIRRVSNCPEDLNTERIPLLAMLLYDFMLGLKHGLHVDIDLKFVQGVLEELAGIARSPEGRARVSILQGIFNCYRPRRTTSLTIPKVADRKLLRMFDDLVEDVTFQELSRERYLLGFPTRLKRSLTNIKRCARDILDKKPFQGVFDLSSKIVHAATSVPVPDSEFAKSLLNQKYLPPVVSIGPLLEKARRTWMKISPEDQR